MNGIRIASRAFMPPETPKVSFGFTNKEFPPGVHICQIFSEDEEREKVLLEFVLAGLRNKERTFCYIERTTEQIIDEFLAKHAISLRAATNSGQFSLAQTKDVYFHNGRFDPDLMLDMAVHCHEEAVSNGLLASRMIGEMPPGVQQAPGGDRLLEYEARISILLRHYPMTAVCQYDARLFDGATIMDILKVHSLMIIRGSVVHNPFYTKPEDYLGKHVTTRSA